MAHFHLVHITLTQDAVVILTKDESKLKVMHVTGHASDVGIKDDDVIIAIDGDQIFPETSCEDISDRIRTGARPLKVTTRRQGLFPNDDNEFCAYEWDAVFEGARLGILLDNKSDQVFVYRCSENSEASKFGVRTGDILQAIKGSHVEARTHHTELAKRIVELERPLTMTFYRPAVIHLNTSDLIVALPSFDYLIPSFDTSEMKQVSTNIIALVDRAIHEIHESIRDSYIYFFGAQDRHEREMERNANSNVT